MHFTCPLHWSRKHKYLFFSCCATANSSYSFWPRWAVLWILSWKNAIGRCKPVVLYFPLTATSCSGQRIVEHGWNRGCNSTRRRNNRSCFASRCSLFHRTSFRHEQDHESCSRTRLHGKLVETRSVCVCRRHLCAYILFGCRADINHDQCIKRHD